MQRAAKSDLSGGHKKKKNCWWKQHNDPLSRKYQQRPRLFLNISISIPTGFFFNHHTTPPFISSPSSYVFLTWAVSHIFPVLFLTQMKSSASQCAPPPHPQLSCATEQSTTMHFVIVPTACSNGWHKEMECKSYSLNLTPSNQEHTDSCVTSMPVF